MPAAPCWSRPGTELGACLVDKSVHAAVWWQLASGCFFFFFFAQAASKFHPQASPMLMQAPLPLIRRETAALRSAGSTVSHLPICMRTWHVQARSPA